MRIIAAFLVMGLLGFIAFVLAVVSALIQLLPFIAVALIVALLIRIGRKRPAHRGKAVSRAPAPRAPIAPRPGQPQRAVNGGGWVLVPMWIPGTPQSPAHPRVLDAEVIDQDGRHV
jgi:hypothetical protein